MKACGNTPPINIKSLPSTRSSVLSSPADRIVDKGAYMNHERLRWARLFDVPMKETTPPGFPANTLPVAVSIRMGYESNLTFELGSTSAHGSE